MLLCNNRPRRSTLWGATRPRQRDAMVCRPRAPCAVTGVDSLPLIQRFCNRRKLPILDEAHLCNGMLPLQRWKDTHRMGPRVRFDRGVDDRVERLLGLGHGGTLGFGGGEILATR